MRMSHCCSIRNFTVPVLEAAAGASVAACLCWTQPKEGEHDYYDCDYGDRGNYHDQIAPRGIAGARYAHSLLICDAGFFRASFLDDPAVCSYFYVSPCCQFQLKDTCVVIKNRAIVIGANFRSCFLCVNKGDQFGGTFLVGSALNLSRLISLS